MRATVEKHPDSMPPIRVSIIKGKEDVCLKISDLGGGIRRSHVDQLFKYMYSTAPEPPRSGDFQTVPLAGEFFL